MAPLTVFSVLFLFSAFLTGTKANINVALYSESYCPYCCQYVKKTVMPLLEEGIMDFANFTLVISGNAFKDVNGTIGCQHGKVECLLNKYLNCGIAKSVDVHQWLPFVTCVEESRFDFEFDNAAIIECAAKMQIDPVALIECAHGEEGNELQEEAFAKTKALAVPHKWVPWLVVDDKPITKFSAESKLKNMICLTIEEDKRPKACYKTTGVAPGAPPSSMRES